MRRLFQKLTISSVANPQVLAVNDTGLSASLTFNQTLMDYVTGTVNDQSSPKLVLPSTASRPGFFEGQSVNVTTATGITVPFRTNVIGIDDTDLYLQDPLPDAGAPPPYAQPTGVIADFDTYGTTPNSRGFSGNVHIPQGNSRVGQGGSSPNGKVLRAEGIILWGYHLTGAVATTGDHDLEIWPTIKRPAPASSLYVNTTPDPAFAYTVPTGAGTGFIDFGGITLFVPKTATLAAGEQPGPAFAASISDTQIQGHIVFSYIDL